MSQPAVDSQMEYVDVKEIQTAVPVYAFVKMMSTLKMNVTQGSDSVEIAGEIKEIGTVIIKATSGRNKISLNITSTNDKLLLHTEDIISFILC